MLLRGRIHSLAFVASKNAIAVSTAEGMLELRRLPDLSPLSRLAVQQPLTLQDSSVLVATNSSGTSSGVTAAEVNAAHASPRPPPPLGSAAPLSPVRSPPAVVAEEDAALCVDWAPDPARPGVICCVDGRGTVAHLLHAMFQIEMFIYLFKLRLDFN